MMEDLSEVIAIITDLKLLTPTNIEEEKRKFFADAEKTYNPQFTYPEIDFSIEDYRKKLEKHLLEPHGKEELTALVHERIRELLLWLDLHEWRGRQESLRVSEVLWGTPSKKILEEAAKEIKKTKFEKEEKNILGKDIVDEIKKALSERKYTNWKVELVKGATRAQLNTQKNIIRINPEGKFSKEDIQKIIVHEIDTHIRRYENGKEQKHFIFALGTAQQIETEEGLAAYQEKEAGLLNKQLLRRLALMTLSVEFAKTHSFAQTYIYLSDFVDEEKAFTITMRVKRGLRDTSQPGAFTKSHLYYTGYQKLLAIDKKDIPYLFVGKVSYIHLPLIKKLVESKELRLIK